MSQTQFDLIVIGAGPGGYVAAIRAAQLGLKTALIEKQHLGGICLNWGCIPTKALLSGADFAQQLSAAAQFGFEISEVNFNLNTLVAHSRKVSSQLVQGIAHLLKKHEVSVFEATARFIAKEQLEIQYADGHTQQLRAPHIIVATGARASKLPNLPESTQIWSYKEALVPDQVPQSLLVIGSGAIGSEFASLYQRLGSQVTLLDMAAQILPTEDKDVATYMQQQFQQQGMQVLTQSSVKSVLLQENAVQVELMTPQGVQTLQVEKILSAVGVTPNTENLGLDALGIAYNGAFIAVDQWCRTNVAGVYAIGDVAGAPCLAHKASHEAVLCVEKIAGLEPRNLLKQNLPACIFTSPQVASLGLTEAQAEAAGLSIQVGKFPLQANGKALASGHSTGFVKTIFHAQSGELLGAHLVGHEVTEHIHGLAIAKALEATDETLAHVVFPHPTLSEAIHESILAAMQRAIHL